MVGEARGLHGRGLRQRHVVEVGQADVVPKAVPHLHPVVQGIQFLSDVAPNQNGEQAGDEAVLSEQQVQLLSPPGHVPTVCLCRKRYLRREN